MFSQGLLPRLPRLLAPALLVFVPAVSASAAPADPRGDRPSAPALSPQEQRALFHVPPGFEVQLVAAEPDIQKPLNLSFDAAGRLWVTGTTMYPWPGRTDAVGQEIAIFDREWNDNGLAFRATSAPPAPEVAARDSVRVLSDFGPDGRARKIEVFADGLNIPIGVQPLPRRPGAKGDTVIVHSIPAIWRMEDVDGDGRADRRERLFGDFGFKDTHGMASSFTYWADGWIYGTHGFANRSEIRDGSGQITLLDSGNTYRFRPDGSRFEVWTRGQTNPFGLAFDERGDVYTADSHSKPVYLLVAGGFYEGIGKQHDGLGFAPAITQDNHGSTSIAGVAAYAADIYPAEFRGNLFNGNPVTRRVNRARLDWTGSTPQAVRVEDFLTSDDPLFRPVQVKLGPDGALWIADFYNPIIGHYEVPLTHPARDRSRGRIWRVVWRGLDGRAEVPALPRLAEADVETLTRALRAPNLVLRALAANELADRFGGETAQAALAQATAAGGIEALPAALALNRVAPDLPADLPADVSDVAASLRTLRVLADRGSLGERERAWVTRVAAEAPIGHATRAMADLFVRRPEPWQADLILRLQPRVPAGDTELIYALRLALKAQLARAADADLAAWRAVGPGVDAYIADVAVAVPSPVSAAFLLGHLERTAFAGERAGEFARHAVRHLPPEQLEAAVGAMIRSLEQAPLAQRLALAEGLSSTLVQNRRALPDSVRRWMVDTLLEIAPGADVPLARRAAEALREPSLPEKVVPLTAVAGRIDLDYGVRLAAARGLPAGNPAVLEMLGRVARRPEEAVRMRRIAVIQLGTVPTVAAAREHLAAALPGAPVDLSLAIATELARTNEGAKALMDAVDAGKAPALLLRHRDLANALAARDASVRERAERLTAALPPEDARLDAVIAERNGSFAAAVKDLHRGAAVFAQNCAACHRIGGTGGNLGPNLDGIGVRGASRLIEDILDPSRNVDPAFRLASVTLRNGETVGGMDLREEGSELRVVDPATGTERRFAKADVVSHAVLASSAMPAAFESALSEQEFHDLLAYLLRPSA